MRNFLESAEISRGGSFKDYFGDEIKVGDTVVFLATDFRGTNDFYKAEVKSLIAGKTSESEDYCVVKIIHSPYSMPKVKDGSKKRCDLCVIVNK